MITIYKPLIKNFDDFLDKTMRNPKDLFSSHLRGYMSDEACPKAIIKKILRAKIALEFHRTEERNIGLDNEYYPTLNRKNEATPGVEKICCEPSDNLVVNDRVDLGEDFFKVRRWG